MRKVTVTEQDEQDRMHAVTAVYQRRGTTFVGRSKQAIGHMFNGRGLVDPGLVRISYWRPGDSDPGDQVWGYCGVARA